MKRALRDKDYRELLLLRTDLRRFLRRSEDRARAAGMTPAQHQLLLAIRGHDDQRGPMIADVANYLLLRHNTAVELVDRAVAAGLITRVADRDDGRVVRLGLLPKGEQALEDISLLNRDELHHLAEHFRPLWFEVEADTRDREGS